MRTGRLFWGVLLIQIGLTALLHRLGILPQSWYLSWAWWPLVLLLIGASMLIRVMAIKAILIVLTALCIGLLFSGLFHHHWWPHDNISDAHRAEKSVQFLSESYDSTTVRASARVDMIAGEVLLMQTTEHLMYATARTNQGEFSLSSSRSGEQATVNLSQINRGRPFGNEIRNELSVRLHPDPIWNLEFDLAAADLSADLSEFRTESVSVDAGAASIDIIMGGNVERADLRIDAGAASIRLHVPRSAGCEINIESGLSSTEFPDFVKSGNDRYRTENFDVAEMMIYIALDIGASSIRVDRY